MGGSQTFQGACSLCCTLFQAHAWELVFALLVRKTLGGMYFEMHKQFISQRAGCEHTDDHREVGWGTRKHFKAHEPRPMIRVLPGGGRSVCEHLFPFHLVHHLSLGDELCRL